MGGGFCSGSSLASDGCESSGVGVGDLSPFGCGFSRSESSLLDSDRGISKANPVLFFEPSLLDRMLGPPFSSAARPDSSNMLSGCESAGTDTSLLI
jgi:hypothetical protein